MPILQRRRADLRPGLAFRLAITGHRSNGSAPLDAAAFRPTLDHVCATVGRLAHEAHAPSHHREEPVRLTLLSGLAEGADRLAAQAALEAGWRLHAVLPFPEAAYRRDFVTPGSVEAFDGFLARSSAITVLDGVPGSFDAYQALGDVLVWNADILLAIWDGRPARGAGGVATVIARARRDAMPIIRVDPVDPASAWLEDLAADDEGRSAGLSGIGIVVARLLAVPAETPVLRQFLTGDYPRRPAPRLHDRLVAAIAGAGRASPLAQPDDPGAACGAAWRGAWTHLAPDLCEGIVARFAVAHGWADHAGLWYAASFRQAYTAIFLLTVAAVLAAGIGAVGSDGLAFLPEAAEVVLLATMLFYVRRERQSRGQDRWLQLRALAERLRHLAVLWPLARTTPLVRVPGAVPGLQGEPQGGVEAEGWVAWYLRATVREAGLVPGHLDTDHLGRVREWVLAAEVGPQRAFHEGAMRRARAVHAPLERTAEQLVVLAVCLAALRLTGAVGFVLADVLGWPPLAIIRVERIIDPMLHALAVTLPALAGGIHGFLGMADFEGGILRSGAIAPQLARLGQQLRLVRGPSLAQVGDLVAEVIRTMEGELGIWRTGAGSRRLQA